jgi:hypothetical protein
MNVKPLKDLVLIEPFEPEKVTRAIFAFGNFSCNVDANVFAPSTALVHLSSFEI